MEHQSPLHGPWNPERRSSHRHRPPRVLAGMLSRGPARGAVVCSLIVTSALHAGATSAPAQTGSLTGRVTDAQGGAVPGVAVTARAPAPATPVTATSDGAGAYALALEPGTYTVTFTLSGLDPQQREDVRVTPGEVRVLDVTLPLAALAERVDVVGVTPLAGSGVSRDRVAAGGSP